MNFFSFHKVQKTLRRPIARAAGTFLLAASIVAIFSYAIFLSIEKQERFEAYIVASTSAEQVENSLTYALSASRTLAVVVEQHEINFPFDTVAAKIMASFGYVDAVELAPNGIVQYVYPYEPNKGALGFNILASPAQQQEAQLAIEKQEAVFAGPLNLVQGGVGVVGRQPIYFYKNGKKEFWGFSLVVIRIESLLKSANLNELENKGYLFQISRIEPATQKQNIFAGNFTSKVTNPISVEAHLPNNVWNISVFPRDGWTAHLKTIPFFGIGMLFALLSGFFTWFIAREPQRLQKLIEKANAELKESEERYRAISDVTSDYLFSSYTDDEGKLQHRWLGGAFEKITGYTKEEYIAHGGWRGTLHPDDVEIDMQDFKKLSENQKIISELRTIKKNGELCWVRVYANPIWDNKENKLIGIHGAVQDITAHKLAELRLQENEEKLRNIFSSMEEGMAYNELVYNDSGEIVDYRVLEINPAFERISGLRRSEVIGKLATDLYKMDSAYIQSFWREHINDDAPIKTELYNEQSKSWKHISTSKPVNGRFVTSFIDITENKNAEIKLRQSEERYRNIVENLQQAYYEADSRGLFTYCNPGLLIIGNYTEEELLGTSVFRMVIPEHRKWVMETYKQWQHEKRTQASLEFMVHTKPGNRFWVEQTTHFEYDDAGNFVKATNFLKNITERKLSQEQLLQSEKRFRTLVEGMNEGMLQVDNDDRIVYCNNRLCEMLGYNKEELIGKIGYEILLDESNAETILQARERRKQKLADSYTTRLRRKDGNYIWVYISGAPVTDANGEVIGSFGVFTDITKQKNDEAALQKNIEQIQAVNRLMETITHGGALETLFDRALSELETLLDAERSAILLVDSDGIMRFKAWRNLSDSYRKLAEGHSPWKQGDSNIATVVVPDVEKEPSLQKLSKNILSEGIRALAFIPLLHNGVLLGKFMLYCSEEKSFTADEREFAEIIAGHIAVAVARKKSEQQILESEKKYRLLADNMTDVVWTIDMKTMRFSYVSPSVLLLRGYTPEEVMAQPIEKSLTPDSYQKAMELFSQAIKNIEQGVRATQSKLVELEQPCKDGSTVWTEVSTVLIFDDNGAPLQVIGVSRNITERKQTEQALLQTQKMESLGVLAGGVAHDFNNILQAILGHATIAFNKVGAEHPASANIRKLESAAMRAADLTRQLLAYSGRGKFVITNINCNTIINENIHLFEVSIPKNVQLKFSPLPNLPFIAADAGQIQQVIMNLIINAGEAIGNKHGQVLISTNVYSITEEDSHLWTSGSSSLQPGKYIVIEVKDTGCGMSKETLAKIFDPFFSTKFTGRGLGLAAVLGIIIGHRGGIQVESMPNVGTTFRVAFPVSKNQQEEIPEPQQVQQHHSGAVLIIDDEELIIEIVEETLHFHSIQTFSATSGEDGIAIYTEKMNEISVVLLDFSMPGMSGQETFKHLLEINPNVKVVLSSGYSESHAMQLFGVGGLSGFIQKPYHPDSLYKELSKHLS